MALVTDAHQAEGQWSHLESTPNKVKSLRFQASTQRPIVSKMEGKNFNPLRTLICKVHLGGASYYVR